MSCDEVGRDAEAGVCGYYILSQTVLVDCDTSTVDLEVERRFLANGPEGKA